MSNDAIFITQIVAIFAAIASPFALYRLLVSQKDAAIQLLKERLEAEKAKTAELKSQAPDALVEALSKRIVVMTSELSRLRSDDDAKESEITKKQAELEAVRASLSALSALIRDSDLVCPKCSAPLLQRSFETIHGCIDGREVEGDIEFREYECGASFRDSDPISPCKKPKA